MDIVRTYATAALCSVVLLGCPSSQHEEAGTLRKPVEQTADNDPKTVPPNNCRLIATVESIDQTLQGENDRDPCRKAPCTATIRIDSVLGYGSAFPAGLARSQRIAVRFAFTLGATREVLPDVRPELPGLTIGSTFEALVSAASVMGSSEPSYTIYSYRKE